MGGPHAPERRSAHTPNSECGCASPSRQPARPLAKTRRDGHRCDFSWWTRWSSLVPAWRQSRGMTAQDKRLAVPGAVGIVHGQVVHRQRVCLAPVGLGGQPHRCDNRVVANLANVSAGAPKPDRDEGAALADVGRQVSATGAMEAAGPTRRLQAPAKQRATASSRGRGTAGLCKAGHQAPAVSETADPCCAPTMSGQRRPPAGGPVPRSVGAAATTPCAPRPQRSKAPRPEEGSAHQRSSDVGRTPSSQGVTAPGATKGQHRHPPQ